MRQVNVASHFLEDLTRRVSCAMQKQGSLPAFRLRKVFSEPLLDIFYSPDILKIYLDNQFLWHSLDVRFIPKLNALGTESENREETTIDTL